MGENALFCREVSYPGLVKPYQKENGSIDQSVIESSSPGLGLPSHFQRMNGLHTNPKQRYDPFSRYDDDLGEEHYFLVPKVQGNSLQIQEWRRTIKSSRSLKSIAKLTSDTTQAETTVVGKNRIQTYPQYFRTSQSQGKIIDDDKSSGEYCYISSEDKLSKNSNKEHVIGSSLRGSFYHMRDRERFQDFASKFATDEDKTLRPQSSSHSFEERKFDTWVELEGMSDSKSKTKISRTQPEKIIDYCTCMVCVKAIFYHCDEEEDAVASPCSCAGSKGSVLKRWTCLSLLACLMPCIFCYLPAKGCLNLCSTCGNNNRERSSDTDSNLKARYRMRDKRKIKETTTLL